MAKGAHKMYFLCKTNPNKPNFQAIRTRQTVDFGPWADILSFQKGRSVEDFVLRLSSTISTMLCGTIILANMVSSCQVAAVPASDPVADAAGPKAGPNDISAYYGFGELEMVKLDKNIKDLTITDFDRDGRNDIAVVNNLKAKIEILLQKESVGPEAEAVTVDPADLDVNRIAPPTRFKRQSVSVSQRIFSFACGDLNSDELPDLAFYGEPRGLYVILQKALLGNEALLCTDLNNDGADDLALAGKNVVYLILQRPDGSLDEPAKYPTTANVLGLRAGDLNGDAINDLIMVTNDADMPLHVRFGLKTGQLGPLQRFFIEKPQSVQLHNIDDRAGDEILTVDLLSHRLICYGYAPEEEKDADWPVLFYPLSLGKQSTDRDLVVADFDGDGLDDVIVSEPSPTGFPPTPT
jgi:hypothetical protein